MPGWMAAAGALAAAAFGAAFVNAVSVETGNHKVAARLGLTEQESRRAGDAAAGAYKAGFGESMAGVQEALSAISPSDVRTWYTRSRKELADAGRKRAAASRARAIAAAKKRGLLAPPAPVAQTGESRLRQGYTLLRSILATAGEGRAHRLEPVPDRRGGIGEAPGAASPHARHARRDRGGDA